MTTITAKNDGDFNFTVTHGLSGSTLTTDAPSSMGGKDATFSPTDLCDAALLTCTGTFFCAKAKGMGLDCTGMKLSANHAMAKEKPSRISTIELKLEVPFAPDAKSRQILIMAAKACPVHNTLDPKTDMTLTVAWSDGKVDTIKE